MSDIRSEILKIRKSLQENDCRFAGERILVAAKRMQLKPPFLFYSPVKGEVDTTPLFSYFRTFGETGFPSIQGDRIEFRKVKELKDLQPGTLAPEPRSNADLIDLNNGGTVFVPGVAFNRENERLGYGKGYYDRFLKGHPRLLRLGLAHDFQVVQQVWTKNEWDQAMDWIITPSALWGSPKIRYGPRL